MLLHIVLILFRYLSCLGAIICDINTMGFASVYAYIVCDALVPSCATVHYRPLSRRLDRCDCTIQNESRDPNGGNVYYVTVQITFLTRKFRNGERTLHCDVVHIRPTIVCESSLTLDCNGVFAVLQLDIDKLATTAHFIHNIRIMNGFFF